ncbi:TAXI family TRAP transporter solute-binding subunit [Orrella daihaiensis]|uniref:TAXI family TRAP transporter solute-binding subunit n=1 Tax=Orrella daihaiensis TaxID=2782176 RepID=A0ABY4AK15_9BURK|nr:TAXI family TRAP transporter solute-binding subunit [Orrella daihaiensis]UOD50298.1 TAXI family TRAP transporter solute-binding subunit [Orrella daihaiensis]
MKKITKLSLAAAAVTAALASAPAAAQNVTFMTGPQGGVWVPLGGALKGMWEKAVPGLNITITPGAGIANVRGVDEKKAQIGMSNSSTAVDGVQGKPPYKNKTEGVCQLANLYPQYFQVVAQKDAGIKSFKDLKGKRLVTQPRGNTAEVLTSTVLKLNGMTYDDLSKANFQAGYTDAVSMMKDGHADVFTLGTAAPSSAVMDLANSRDVVMVPVDDETMKGMREMNPAYNKLIIKAGTYPGQTEDVPAIGYFTHVIVACDLPNDLVYTMVKTMAENIPDMAAVSKSMANLTPQIMATEMGVPMHPGAVKYYKEVGAM